jgi:hypothetical protein
LNGDKSDIGNGIAVFDYIWLRDAGHTDESKYPIYLTITRESIDFRVHYCDERRNTGEDGKTIVKHLHNTILSLPLSDNMDVKDGLTGALVGGYKTNFPTWEKDESNYLFKLLASTIRDHDSKKENVYSTLKEFNVNIEELKEIFDDVEKIKYEKYKVTKDKAFDQCIERLRTNDKDSQYVALTEKIKKYNREGRFLFSRFIRKLILDFIFDLEHTRVFQSSPYYENISIKLKANYFFSALAAKANFYYQTKNLSDFKPTPKQPRSIDIEVEYYLKSEIEWTKHIRNIKSEENFNGYQDEWFNDPIDEMKAVYDKKKPHINGRLEEEEKERKKNKEKKDKLIAQYEANGKLSDKWRIAHYDIWTSYFSFLPRCFIFPRLFISTVAAWLTFILGSGLWGNIGDGGFQRITDHIYVVIGFCFALCLACFFWIRNSGLKHKIAPVKKIKTLYTKSSVWITCTGFIYSLIIGLILTMFIYEEVDGKNHFPLTEGWETVWDNMVCIFCHPVPYLWVGVCLSMFISLVIQSFMDNKPPTESL